jgi:hypothetical protein
MPSDSATMARACSELASLTSVTGWKESKVGMETVGEGEEVGMLVAIGVKVDVAVATLVGGIAAMGVEGSRAAQAVSRSMVSSADMINR